MIKRFFQKFWEVYERYTEQNILIATALFLTQILHLTWLALTVIAARLRDGDALWNPSEFFENLVIFFDYLEIPAIIAVSLVYINMLRKGENVKKAWIILILLNSQWLHIFWITDEFVVNSFGDMPATILPVWLAWVAIFIDYLELPVIYDTLKQSVKSLKKKFISSSSK